MTSNKTPSLFDISHDIPILKEVIRPSKTVNHYLLLAAGFDNSYEKCCSAITQFHQ